MILQFYYNSIFALAFHLFYYSIIENYMQEKLNLVLENIIAEQGWEGLTKF